MGFLDFIPIVGDVTSAISNIGTNIANKKMNDDNNRTQMELAKYNWDKQIDFWHQQNDYNTPSAQMQRFADAGLNPNLMYGQGSNGNSSYSPSPDMPKTSPYRFDNSLASLASSVPLQLAQIKNVESDSHLKDSQAMTEVSKRVQMEYENAVKEQQAKQIELDNALKAQSNPIQIKKLQSELDEINSRVDLAKENLKSVQLQNSRYEALTPTVLAQAEQELINLQKTGKAIDAQTAAAAASAALSRAQALTESEKTKAQQLANEMAKYDLGIAAATQQAKVDTIRYTAICIANDMKKKKIEYEKLGWDTKRVKAQLAEDINKAMLSQWDKVLCTPEQSEKFIDGIVKSIY